MGRKLTLEVIAKQPMADWIWKSHADGSEHDGIRIVGISEGHTSQRDAEEDTMEALKASQLIKKLQDIVSREGDLDIIVRGECPTWSPDVDDIYVDLDHTDDSPFISINIVGC